jgi:hypothetical protein
MGSEGECTVSKYTHPALECLITEYSRLGAPVKATDVARCMRERYGLTNPEHARRGLHSAVCLGYAEAKPSKPRSRHNSRLLYTPTLNGVVDAGIHLGVFTSIKLINPFTAALPTGLTTPSINLLIRLVKPALYCKITEDISLGEPREKLFYGAVTLKALSQLKVNGLKPSHYAELMHYISEATFDLVEHIRTYVKFLDPTTWVPPLQWGTSNEDTEGGSP